jgi:hypothetical protein
MREAIYIKHFRELYLWTSRNTAYWIACESLKEARLHIKNSGIEQTLKVE